MMPIQHYKMIGIDPKGLLLITRNLEVKKSLDSRIKESQGKNIDLYMIPSRKYNVGRNQIKKIILYCRMITYIILFYQHFLKLFLNFGIKKDLLLL